MTMKRAFVFFSVPGIEKMRDEESKKERVRVLVMAKYVSLFKYSTLT